MQTFLAGFILGFSLILAIGAQNAFVLRQGLRREYLLAVCSFCAISDAILIAIGVSSFKLISGLLPWVGPAFLYGGVAFLIWYGWRNFRSALRGGAQLQASEIKSNNIKKTLLTCLALTWLNPHAWLDTVVLVGTISSKYANPVTFGAGAMLASFTFFFLLGYGARLLAPLFARPTAWRLLDLIVAITMWLIAATLLVK
ncbi:MAG TPA: amino acid transporter [Rhodobacteraceae bacterium]|nr:amino acid transporter [Paracoccaceae bacterium]